MFQPSVILDDLGRKVPADSRPAEVDCSHSQVAARVEGSLNSLADCSEFSLDMPVT